MKKAVILTQSISEEEVIIPIFIHGHQVVLKNKLKDGMFFKKPKKIPGKEIEGVEIFSVENRRGLILIAKITKTEKSVIYVDGKNPILTRFQQNKVREIIKEIQKNFI